MTACPECAGPIVLDGKRAERVCVVCGLVVETGVVVAYKVEASLRIQRAQADRKARGLKIGGPQKPINPSEARMLRRLRNDRGWGYRRLAATLNLVRGIDKIQDPRERRRASVSGHTIMRRLGPDGRNTYPRWPKGSRAPARIVQNAAPSPSRSGKTRPGSPNIEVRA